MPPSLSTPDIPPAPLPPSAEAAAVDPAAVDAAEALQSAAVVHLPRASSIQGCQLTAFTQWLVARTAHDVAGDPDRLARWSVTQWRAFWSEFLHWCRPHLALEGHDMPVCVGDTCEHAQFFPGLHLSVADSLLNRQVAPGCAPALVHLCEEGRRTWSRAQLREAVAGLADAMRSLGMRPGDRVVAVMRNDDRAVIAALAVIAVGATLSTASPEMGSQILHDHFTPLAPAWLLAHRAEQPGEAGMPWPQRLRELAGALEGLRGLIGLDGSALGLPIPEHDADELRASGQAARFDWPRFPFNHPLYIVFSSGTTGRPKRIVHGAGGTLLEHLKEHRLHTDLGPADRLYFHTSCGWMMWNWQLSALASGVTLVTRDGPMPAVDALWRLVAGEAVTVFGTSPSYLRMSRDAGIAPARELDLSCLRAILSTGAVLPEAAYHWVREQVGDLPLQSISGGTDILGCFVLGHPARPVQAGLAQCKSLAMDVQAWQDGAPRASGTGVLVCANPFPSRPLGFDGDPDGRAFHAAYFSQNAGVWTHGDLIEFTADGQARLHGRCDGVLNVQGIKFSPALVLRVIDDEPLVQAAMVVQASAGGAGPLLVALLVLREGASFDTALVARLRRDIARRLSAVHVPDLFLDVPQLPVTHSGKPSEMAARCALQGQALANEGALRNPDCLAAIAGHPSWRAVAAPEAARASTSEWGTVTTPGLAPGPGIHGEPAMAPDGSITDLMQRLQPLWAASLGLDQIGPDDHFFELGGNSLRAVRLLAAMRTFTGRALPLSSMLQAPTVRQMADLMVHRAASSPSAPQAAPVPVRAGVGRALFIVHGLSGSVMECWPLVRALRTPRPLWGLQAAGLDGEEPPQDRVEAMADRQVQALRAVQPAGPYAICGFSFGGLVALEIARRLSQAGERIELLCLLDAYVWRELKGPAASLDRIRRGLRRLAGVPLSHWPGQLAAWCGARPRRTPEALAGTGDADMTQGPWQLPDRWSDMSAPQQAVYRAMQEALRSYRPQAWTGGDVLLVRASLPLPGYLDPMPVWRRVCAGGLRVVKVPGEHLALVAAHAPQVAQVIDQALRSSTTQGPPAARFRSWWPVWPQGLRW